MTRPDAPAPTAPTGGSVPPAPTASASKPALTPASAPASAPARTPPRKLRRLKLRTRLTLAATLAVAIGIGAGVSFAYLALRSELLGSVDLQLSRQAVAAQHFLIPNGNQFTPPPTHVHPNGTGALHRQFGDAVSDMQVVFASGRTNKPSTQADALPVSPSDLAVAAGTEAEQFRTIGTGASRVRVVTAPLGDGAAVQIALPLNAVEGQLNQIGLELLIAGAAGVLCSAFLGWWVTRTALRPVARLTETAERITATKDLAHRLDTGARADRDELGRLASSFNAMLDAVQDSTDRQRQLVADASHELRTPLTSLRTNVEVMRKIDRLDPADRAALIDAVLIGIDDLTGLVTDTVELARGEEPAAAIEEFRWDLLVDRSVERARGHWPDVLFLAGLAPCEVAGVPERVTRAVANLLDNAAKFSGGSGEVRVGLTDGTLSVRDHGPGIPEEDLPHVFDRFYRSAKMRDRPGSGLGLAIVAQVADSHGGTVSARNADGGGALLTLSLPVISANSD
jgi:two-component system, OmpR family, sensor histidine kinase MprB